MTTGASTDRTAAAQTGAAGAPLLVVGYSAKPEGLAALNWAISEGRLRGATLIVVHSLEQGQTGDLEERLAASGLAYEVRPGDDALDPAEDLISTADTRGAEFIVIGLRKRSPVGKLLLGSNAQRVLLDASCPVMAVKTDPS